MNERMIDWLIDWLLWSGQDVVEQWYSEQSKYNYNHPEDASGESM